MLFVGCDGKWGDQQKITPCTEPKGRRGLWKSQLFSNGSIQVRKALSLLVLALPMYQGFKGNLVTVLPKLLELGSGGRIGTTQQRTRALESGHIYILRNDHETYETQGGPFLPTL